MTELQVNCAHTYTLTVYEPKGSIHYARLVCGECGWFLRFIPRPENTARRLGNEFKLLKLSMAPGLDDWEREFVQSASRRADKLSPKQQDILDRLAAKYLGKGEAK
jgi:hypothetical protein